MRKIVGILGVLLFIFSACEKKSDQTEKITEIKEKRAQKIVVTFVLGKAVAKAADSPEWKVLKVGNIIGLNDTIRVGDNSRVILQTETGSVLTIKDKSEVVITSLLNIQNNQENTEVALKVGKTILNPRKQEGDSKFSVRTPSMVAGVRGTVFSVEYNQGQTKVMVKEGKVSVKPALQDKEKEAKIQEITLNPGEKAITDQSKIAELEKKDKIEEITKEAEKIIQLEKLDKKETLVVETYKEELQKMDIKINENNEVVSSSDTVLASLTVSSVGQDIFINNQKVSKDFYSALYPEKTELQLEIKKANTVLLQQKVIIPREGVKIELTPQEEKKILEELSTQSMAKPLNMIAQGYYSKSEDVFASQDNLIAIENANISFASLSEPSKPALTLSYNTKAKPVVSDSAIYLLNKAGNMEVYDLAGRKIKEIPVGNIILPTAISEDNGVAFVSNSVGLIVGVDKEGNEKLRYTIKDTMTSPLSVSGNLVVAASPFKVYVLKNNAIFQQFNIKERIIHKIGIMGDKLILPQRNNIILITDLAGNTLKTINAQAGDIETLNDKIFFIRYSHKTLFFNLEGQKIKDIPSNEIVVFQGKICYAAGKTVVFDSLGAEKQLELEENIKNLVTSGNKILAITVSGKIFQLNF